MDRRVFLFHNDAVVQIIVGEQDGIIYRRPKLQAAYNDIAHINHLVAQQVGNGHIDKNGDFYRNHNHNGDDSGLEGKQDDKRHTQQGKEIYKIVIRCDDLFNVCLLYTSRCV